MTVTAGPSSTDGAWTARVEAARADLARRLGLDPAAIAVDRIEEVTWPSAALGCPELGRPYDPTPVPGYLVVLRVGERRFYYHGATDGGSPSLCEYLD